jgi:hypothetical protein
MVKRPWREDDHSPPSSAEVKNAWSYTFIPQYAFMVWCSVKHRDIFILLYERNWERRNMRYKGVRCVSYSLWHLHVSFTFSLYCWRHAQRKSCVYSLSRGWKVATLSPELPCERPVTYAHDRNTSRKPRHTNGLEFIWTGLNELTLQCSWWWW